LISTIELAILVFIDRSIPHFGAFTLCRLLKKLVRAI
jgi:hypothetical protein